jgi:tetratricopeptide (TPR) repeat protein
MPPLLLVLLAFLGQASQPEPALVEAQSLINAGKLSRAETVVRSYLDTHKESADAHYHLAYILFRQGNPKFSLAEFMEGARYRNPSALDMQVAGSDYFLLEDFASSDKWLTLSVERDPKDAVAVYFLGRAKYNEKHFEDAARALMQCIGLDPTNVRAEHYLGLSFERLGRMEDALEAYRKGVSLDHGDGVDPGLFVDLGALLASNSRAAEAVPYLLTAVQIASGDSRAHRELGKAYLSLNRLEDAQAELEKAAELAPQEAPVHYLLAQVYRRRGLAEKARAETERYTALSGAHSSPDSPLAEARALLELGKAAEAEQLVRKYLEPHKSSADAHYLLGYILFKQQKAKESLAEYTEAAKYRTPSAYDLEVVGTDYVLLEDYVDADKWFTKSVEWNPGNRQAFYYLGRAKYNENRFAEAIAIFLQCLKLDPKDVKAEDNLGLSYQALGRTDEAIGAYRQAIAWQADLPLKDAGPYVDLGAVLVENGRPEEAVPYLLQAAATAPRDVKAHRELGKAYLTLNRLAEAQTELEKVVELAPRSAPGHFMLGQLYRKRGLADKAKVEFDRYAALNGTHSTPDGPER